MADTGGAGSVAGLVLAAGRSERMGEPKALLELPDGRTFLEAGVQALRQGGCGEVVAAVGSPGAAFTARSAGARIAQGQPEGEQIDSLRSGLDELEAGPESGSGDGASGGSSVGAVVVLPVDHPLVRATTIQALIAGWRGNPGAVVRPVYDGRPGHPTLFPAALWSGLRDPSLEDGARSVVDAARVVDVPVDDAGVLVDIDSPEDYRRHVDGPGGGDA